MRSFVATQQEIAAIEAVIARPRFVNCQMLSVVVKTDPAWLREVIPAPLEPDGDTVRFMVGRWQSNCVADFAGSGVYVPARLGDDAGEYIIAMYMDSDAAILYGREVFGEPKKQASSGTFRGGDIASAWVERHGERIIHLEASLTTDNGPVETTGLNFNIKAQPACDGKGLESDAVVTAADFDVRFNVNLSGTGAVRLTGTAHDPLGSIPLGEVVQSVWQEGDLFATTRRVATIPAAQFAPYFYARVDDYALLDTESRVLA
jgi:acetoacetate decarboxylase